VRLVAISNDGGFLQGSGLHFSAGLCITAKHVFDDFLERLDTRQMRASPSLLVQPFRDQIRAEDEAILILESGLLFGLLLIPML